MSSTSAVSCARQGARQAAQNAGQLCVGRWAAGSVRRRQASVEPRSTRGGRLAGVRGRALRRHRHCRRWSSWGSKGGCRASSPGRKPGGPGPADDHRRPPGAVQNPAYELIVRVGSVTEGEAAGPVLRQAVARTGIGGWRAAMVDSSLPVLVFAGGQRRGVAARRGWHAAAGAGWRRRSPAACSRRPSLCRQAVLGALSASRRSACSTSRCASARARGFYLPGIRLHRRLRARREAAVRPGAGRPLAGPAFRPSSTPAAAGWRGAA